jgi:G3E family GTPase
MPSPLPVTLVGGFLGAGKTSVLHHIISQHEGGYLAALVENPGPLNQDARALRGLCAVRRRLRDVVAEIPNADGEAQLGWLAQALRELAESERFERVLIEVAGTTNPARLAEHFLPGGVLGEWTELEQIVSVVDAVEVLGASRAPEPPAFWEFQREQIAGATLVVLNKCDLLPAPELERCRAFLGSDLFADPATSPRVVETAYGEVPPEAWSQPAGLDAVAEAVARKPRLLPRVLVEKENAPPLSAALYRVHRPFHPTRFWQWFNAEHAGLLRMKGLIWLASRHVFVGGISRTRMQNGCGAAGVWWDALPREEWPEDEAALRRLQDNWREPHGDRRQELVVIGEPALLDHRLRPMLDACLLTDEEFARPVREWATLPDPFPAWDLEG